MKVVTHRGTASPSAYRTVCWLRALWSSRHSPSNETGGENSSDPSGLQLQQICRAAAIHGDHLSGDKASHRAAEKKGEVRDIGPRALHSERILGAIIAIGHGFSKSSNSLRSTYRSGCDRIDPDPIRSPLHCTGSSSESTPAFAAATCD